MNVLAKDVLAKDRHSPVVATLTMDSSTSIFSR